MFQLTNTDCFPVVDLLRGETEATLEELAYTRSGDKVDSNISYISYGNISGKFL